MTRDIVLRWDDSKLRFELFTSLLIDDPKDVIRDLYRLLADLSSKHFEFYELEIRVEDIYATCDIKFLRRVVLQTCFDPTAVGRGQFGFANFRGTATLSEVGGNRRRRCSEQNGICRARSVRPGFDESGRRRVDQRSPV